MVVKYGVLAVRKCLKYCIEISWKKLLHLRHSTPNSMVYGELGVLPQQIAIDKRIIAYWFRLLSKYNSTYSYCLCRMALTLFSNDLYKTHLICKLDNYGLAYMRENNATR